MAVFKLTSPAFFKSDLNLKLLTEPLLILPHLLHCQPKSFLSLDYLTSSLSLVSFPPLVELFGKALKVVDQRLYLSIGAITLVLQLLDLLVDQLGLKVKLILQFEQLMGDRCVMPLCAFLLALTEQFFSNGHGLLVRQPIHDLRHQPLQKGDSFDPALIIVMVPFDASLDDRHEL